MFGAVIFDEGDRTGPGWASTRGGPAVRIRGTGDLASDVYWWTNLTFVTFQKYSLFRPNLKRADYMRPDMLQLHKELGLASSMVPPSRVAEITAELFDRIMRLAQKHYELTKPVEDSLSDDLFNVLLRSERSLDPDLNAALGQSYQTWSICETVSPTGSKIISFKRPRILHAQEVLATPVPGDQWELITEKDLPAESKRVDWLINQSRPALAKISVQQVDPSVAKIIAYSGGANRERSWVSHPELLSLSRFANIKVDAVFLANDYTSLPLKKPLATGGVMGILSLSMGILAENYWVSLATSVVLNKKSREHKNTIYSPRAVWLSASDRFHMLMPALMMHASGFSVKAYGRGGVNVAVQRGLLDEARSCAIAAGLNAPLNVQEDINTQEALLG